MVAATDLDGMAGRIFESIKDVSSKGVPLAISLRGPAIDEDGGVEAPKVVKLIRNMDKLLKAIAAEIEGSPKVRLVVTGIDRAEDAFTVRFELQEVKGRRS